MRLRPAAVDEGQGVVVLAGQQPLGRLAGEQLAIEGDRLGPITTVRLTTGFFAQLGIVAAGHAKVLLEQQGLHGDGLERLQLHQIALRSGGTLGSQLQAPQAIQGLGTLRIELQQFLPHLSSALGFVALLPEASLLDEQLRRAGLGREDGNLEEGGQQAERQGDVLVHGVFHEGCRRPSAAKR